MRLFLFCLCCFADAAPAAGGAGEAGEAEESKDSFWFIAVCDPDAACTTNSLLAGQAEALPANSLALPQVRGLGLRFKLKSVNLMGTRRIALMPKQG